MRAVIVDDQKRTRQGLRLLLNTLSCILEVQEAENGQQAIQLVSMVQPDIVIMDARMPLMDGVEATRLIKEKWPQMKVILLSMYPEYQAEAARVGADSFISKGVPPKELLDLVCEILGKSDKE